MKKKEVKHEHRFFPSTVVELSNYCFVLVKIGCEDDECAFETWDWGEAKGTKEEY